MENFYNPLKSIVSKFPTDFNRIVIVGKGESIKQIDKEALSGALIINVNDSELLINGHFTIFYAERVLESLKKNGFKNEVYISSQKLEAVLPSSAQFISADYNPLNNEGVEHIAALFEKNSFELTDFLLLSAIKLAWLINQAWAKEMPIYLIGFDFDLEKGTQPTDASQHDALYREILFKTQKSQYVFIQHYLQDKLAIQLRHVGNASFSSLSVSEFNQVSTQETVAATHAKFDNIAEYQKLLDKVASDNYTLVVAELTNNHIGDADRLRKMIKLAKNAGADMVKIQKRDVDTFYTQDELNTEYASPFGTKLKDYRDGVELDDELMQVLISECEQNEIVWFSSVLDYPSLLFLEKYNPPLIKLPSTISNHRNFLKKAGDEFKGDLVISTGFTDKEYENFVLENFCTNRNLFLLQCTSSYPAPPEACQIAVVRHYEHLGLPNLFPGYSSHDIGSLGCMMAVAAGAKMVEKHVKLGDLDWIHFDGVALDLATNQFETFVKDIRKASIMCGTRDKKIHKQEHHKYTPNENHF
ncbi:N-acetylneuraminate synthase family protein [Flavobacterium sp. 25HG05S-40]|uniref:N-acetylneuraminate synthase family protein n=1 Tax=Flavobacterium sp. 25HG05S-40 TaxID=3458682 RepID=UPI0040440EC3